LRNVALVNPNSIPALSMLQRSAAFGTFDRVTRGIERRLSDPRDDATEITGRFARETTPNRTRVDPNHFWISLLG
jgi:hypothetical protein